MTNKEKYRQLCLTEPSIPIYSKDWWLDATCIGGDWDVAIYEENGEIIGTWCYFYKTKLGFKIITTPFLTKYQGVWFKNPELDLLQNKIITRELLKQLPKFSSLTQFFSPTFTNWLPLYWEKFKQTTKYTFMIDDISDMNKVFDNFAYYRRRDIKRAQKLFTVEIGCDPAIFYDLRKKNLEQLNEKITYPRDGFIKLINACEKHNAGQALLCKNVNNEVVCYTYIIWDNQYSHYLISGFDVDLCKKGASDLLMYETIKYASTKTKSFDFEGSMVKGIAHNLNDFAEKQVPYYLIYKNNLFFQLYHLLKNDTY